MNKQLALENHPQLSQTIRPLLASVGVTMTDIACVFLCVCFFSTWIITVTKQFSLLVIVAQFVFCNACLLAGILTVRLLGLGIKWLSDFPTKFLFGHFVLSSALFFLFFLTKFSVAIDFIILLGILAGIGATIFLRGSKAFSNKTEEPSSACFLCVATSLLGTTLWAKDFLVPIVNTYDIYIIKPFIDCLYHSGIIRSLGAESFTGSLQNPLCFGLSARVYHYASYMIPVFLTQTSGISSFNAYCAFQAPFGLFLSGIAAYVLVRGWWGSWPGFAAAAGLLLIPNSTYHGLANPWFSYHWLTLISPTLCYGISAIVVAWILVFEGLKQRRLFLFPIAFLFAFVCIFHKAHIFIATCLIFAIYPVLFWNSLNRTLRATLIGLIVIVFCLSVHVSNGFNIVRIAFGNSGLNQYLDWVVSMIEYDWLRNSITELISFQSFRVPVGIFVMYFGTFGLFGVACPVLGFILRGKIRTEVLFFPFFVIAVYLVMSLGMAYDYNIASTYEELLHRPFVWAYFVLCAWVTGAAYMWYLGDRSPQHPLWRFALSLLLICLFFVPYALSKEAQIGPSWGWVYAWTECPVEIIRCSNFIRDNSKKGDLIQDSKGDPKFIVSGLADRQEFVVNYLVGKKTYPITLPEPFYKALAAAERFKTLTSKAEIDDFVAAYGIKWYVLHPDDTPRWPREILDKPSFQENGFRVFRFDHKP